MLKYIKWELINFFKKRKTFAIVTGIVFLLAFIVLKTNSESEIAGFIMFPFMFIMMYLIIGSFFFGAKTVIDTYRKKTFLLESMISYSPAKLLLSKYILAIIINCIYVVVFVFGLAIVLSTEDINLIKVLSELLKNITFSDLLKVFIYLLVYTVSFTAIITLSFIGAKSFKPNGKSSVAMGLVIWYIIHYIQNEILFTVFNDYDTFSFFTNNTTFTAIILINIALICVYYFVTVKLVENKLQIYN